MTQTNNERQVFNPDTVTVTELLEQLEILRSLLKKAEDKAAELASELWVLKGWVSNPTFQSSDVKVIAGLRDAIAKAKAEGAPDKDGKYRVFVNDIVECAGCSDDTVNKRLKRFLVNGLADKDIVKTKNADGSFETATYYSLSPDLFINPSVKLTDVKTQGGKRIAKCKVCDGTNVHKDKRYICDDCGCIMKPSEVVYVDEETVLAEQQAEAEREAEIQAEMDAWQQLQERIEASKPTTEPPDRDCLVCGKREWLWDVETGHWMCVHQYEGGEDNA